MPTALNITFGVDTTADYTAGVLTVSVDYPATKLNQVLPFLVLPGVGTVPSLPATLSAKSSLQF
jgi:hypothetical protein